MIRIFEPTLGDVEEKAVSEVFKDRWPGAGPRVKQFEEEFSRYIGVKADTLIAITSCTEGIFQAIEALSLDGSSEVVMPTVSFIGAAHAVRASGARIRLTDVDKETLNPSLRHIKKAVNSNTKAIILLHFGGSMCDLQDISDFARSKKILLIEDSACSLGSTYENKKYGTFGDIGVWSFDAMKLLVTGDGGMLRVENEKLRSIILKRVKLGGAKPGMENVKDEYKRWWEINPTTWGRKAFMNDLTAAIGIAQLKRIGEFIAKRKELRSIYDEHLNDVPAVCLPPSLPKETVPYFYWIQVPPTARDKLAAHLKKCGVYTTFRYWPLHKIDIYRDRASYPGADYASRTTLLLPIHQNLSSDSVKNITRSIRKFFSSHNPA